MADIFCETRSKSWFSRMGGSIKGIALGILFLAGSGVLLCWNEGRAVTTANSLREGAGKVVTVPDAEVRAANDQKLIHLSGEVRTEESLRDPILGMEAIALRLTRQVEMYQWKEDKVTEKRTSLGGREETTTRYEYAKGWSDQLIPSRDFRHPADHGNPDAMPVPAETLIASKAMLGAFRVPASLIGKMKGDEALGVTGSMLVNLPAEWKERIKANGDTLYLGNDPAQPQVGDARVTFLILKPAVFSILARQTYGTLDAYPTQAGREIERVESGVVSAAVMFDRAQRENAIITWVARMGGYLSMFLGCSMVLKPLRVLADFVPFLGRLAGAGTGLISAVLAFAGSLVIIALAWLAVRPVLGGTLLLAAVGSVVWGIRRGRQRALPPPMRQ